MLAVSLTIAGSDPSGGAGIQADLKTFQQFQTYGTSVITLITAQNTQEITTVEILSPDLVQAQLQAVIKDIPPQAAKTGALGNEEIASLISKEIKNFDFPLVVDPIINAKQNAKLLNPDAIKILKEKIISQAFLVTPNIEEASILSEIDVCDLETMKRAALILSKLGAKNILIKGGHLEEEAIDLLLYENEFFKFSTKKINSTHTHGTGCTFSAAITSLLAKKVPLPKAVQTAKNFITSAISTAPKLGQGNGPLNHLTKVSIHSSE